MLFEMNKPGEKCVRTALYVVLDKKLRGTGLSELVHEGHTFPDKVGKCDTYWPLQEL
ncbi:hypothetical protein [Kocuria sp. CH-021]|uniref:hypothetical protein n=1 Tax=Kocuria sp. CH-021 TaxID=3406735 RepID=UPI003C75B590